MVQKCCVALCDLRSGPNNRTLFQITDVCMKRNIFLCCIVNVEARNMKYVEYIFILIIAKFVIAKTFIFNIIFNNNKLTKNIERISNVFAPRTFTRTLTSNAHRLVQNHSIRIDICLYTVATRVHNCLQRLWRRTYSSPSHYLLRTV
ncbi:hypothetical protein NQ318_004585 [Aromia moschata]|uniref:Uncharacterized protein n=1 Tax=Aromia moschata TaxID=1265417 RepID=A0AAV8XP71_9CUCU|nr:hypothetical protein NQ318_004585 [Aromia moschata]